MTPNLKSAIRISFVFTFAIVAPVLAQDVIGAQPVSNAALATFRIIAGAGIAWGLLRLMSGRHTIEGLVEVGAGALGVAKAQAIAAFLGLGA